MFRIAGHTAIMIWQATSEGETAMAITLGILVGVVMAAIGSALLFRPQVIFNLLLALNPNSDYARRHVRSLEAAVGRTRFVGAISLAWGLFCFYLSVRTLVHFLR